MYFDRAPVIYEDGKQVRDFVNIGDVARANLLVLEDPRADGEVFNVGGGRKVTVSEFARIVAKCFGKDIEPEVSGEFRFGDTRHIFSDISTLRTLGWTPQIPVEQSVQEYIAWLETQPEVEDVSSHALARMRALNVVRKVSS